MSDIAIPVPDSAQRLARDLILRFGWHATAYQILNPGFQFWFSQQKDAVIGFVRFAGVRVVAGAPICASDRLAQVVAEFEQDALVTNEKICFLGCQTRLYSLLAETGNHSAIIVGAQPVWHPLHWPEMLAHRASVRAQLNRARNKGVIAREWAGELETDLPALKECLKAWLDSRGLPPLHFMVEPQILTQLLDRRLFVAQRGNRVEGFLVASPIPGRKGWLLELIARRPDSPNGTAEILVDNAMQTMCQEGSEYVTLGTSPLSQRAQGITLTTHYPLWLRLAFAWARAHGSRFYNFDGLDAFKAKFHPESWEPIFAISNEPVFSLKTLFAITGAFTAGKPFRTMLQGCIKAIKTEWSWLREHIDKNWLMVTL